MNKFIISLSLLFALSARAQASNPISGLPIGAGGGGSVDTSGLLPKIEYQTYAAATYYVDPTGSDSNACTASGTSACATLSSVFARLPLRLRHVITINIAVGTYNESPKLGPHIFSDAAQVLVQGPALKNVSATSPAFATGTVTSYSQTNSSTGSLGFITDTAQEWGDTALRGKYITLTSGAGAGTSGIIATNTSRTFVVTRTFPGIANGNTYALQEPAATFNGTFTVSGIGGTTTASSGVLVSDLAINGGTGIGFFADSNTLRNTNAATPDGIVMRRLAVTTSSVTNAAVACYYSPLAGSSQSTGAISSGGTALFLTRCTWRDQCSFWMGAENGVVATESDLVNIGATAGMPYTLSTGAGAAFTQSGGNLSLGIAFMARNEGTGGGALFTNNARANASNMLAISDSSYGVSVTNMSRVNFSALGPPNVSGNPDISIDGTSYTSSFFNALTPPCVVGTKQSTLCTQ